MRQTRRVRNFPSSSMPIAYCFLALVACSFPWAIRLAYGKYGYLWGEYFLKVPHHPSRCANAYQQQVSRYGIQIFP